MAGYFLYQIEIKTKNNIAGYLLLGRPSSLSLFEISEPAVPLLEGCRCCLGNSVQSILNNLNQNSNHMNNQV